MTIKDLAFRAPPSLAVAIGATTPNPGVPGVEIWSTTEGEKLVWNGSSWQSMAGPAGSVSVSTVTVDFGASGAQARTFDVALTGAVAGQKVLACVSLDMPAGVAQDELEMDPLTVAASVPSNNLVRLVVGSSGTPVSGQRNINLTLG